MHRLRTRRDRHQRRQTTAHPMGRELFTVLFLVLSVLTSVCCGLLSPTGAEQAMVTEEPAAEEPVAEEPAGAPEPTQAAGAPPTGTSLPLVTEATPVPVVVETTSDAPVSEVLGRLDVEYPVRMAPQASDTVILELSVPDLLVAAEPVAVVRVEEAEPVAEGLGRFDAVVYLVSQMRAELASPALAVEPLTPADQPVDLEAVNAPTTWAWTVQAPDTPGKQVMTLRLFRSGDAAPLWIGSLRVDITPAGQLASTLGEESAAEAGAETLALPPEDAPSGDAPSGDAPAGNEAQPATERGPVATVVEALTQDVTGLVLGILSLVGSIVAAMLAAWVERGGGGKRATRRKIRRYARRSGVGPSGPLRALWFRITEAFRLRKR